MNNINLTFPFSMQKERYKQLVNRLIDFKESSEMTYIEDFSLIIEILKFLINNPSLQDPFIDYLASEVFMPVAKCLLMARAFRNKELLDISNNILENMVLLTVIRMNEDDVKLLELMKYILDPGKSYYKLNDIEENSLYSVKYIKIYIKLNVYLFSF